MTCDQCQAACINGVFCHEIGCPNSRKAWVPDRGWVLFVKCSDCGSQIEDGEICECHTYQEEDELQDDYESDEPHTSDCGVWIHEPCDCIMGRL